MGILLCKERVKEGCSYYGLKDDDWQDDDWQETQDSMLQDILGELEKDAARNIKPGFGSSDDNTSLEKEFKPSMRDSPSRDEFSPREEVSPREERSPEILEVERNLRKLTDHSYIGAPSEWNNLPRERVKVQKHSVSLPHSHISTQAAEDQELYLLYGTALEAPLRKRQSLILPRTRRIATPTNVYRRRSWNDWPRGASSNAVNLISAAPETETNRKYRNTLDTDSEIRLTLNREGEIKMPTFESFEADERQDGLKSPSLEPLAKSMVFNDRIFTLQRI